MRNGLVEQFLNVLDLNVTASIVIACVLLARLLLRSAPKVFSYALWGIVLLRLLLPVSVESPVSIVPANTELSNAVEINEVLPEIQFETPEDHTVNQWHREDTASGAVLVQTHHIIDAETYLAIVWILGIALIQLYGMVSFLKLRSRVRAAIPLRKGIYLADHIESPFVMGIFRPRIYLPSGLETAQRRYIIAHERHHMRRCDHIMKALGFLAVSIHWFNPLVWIAFTLASRDMEMSCDEAVIRKLGEGFRADYSETLLNLATGRKIFSGTPLAFGEDDPAGRVRNLAKWKKPAVWVIVICVILCAVLAACLLTDPQTPEADKWGVSVYTQRLSRTGADVLFSTRALEKGSEVAELTYGDALSLQRMEKGTWVDVEELPGYTHHVGDAEYLVTDGSGMVHEWLDRYGELPDGHYRIGKQVTAHYTDGSTEQGVFYTEFFLPDGILTGPIPLEDLPEKYSAEQAMIDGCFVQTDGIARENKDLFHQFAADAENGIPAFIRIVNWHYGEDAQCTVADLSFDGSVYTLTTKTDRYTYRYLKHFTGEKAWENADHDGFEYYVLLNDSDITWEEFNGRELRESEHWTVYADFTYVPDTPRIPTTLAQATLEYKGQTVASTTDFDRLEKIWILFTEAQFLGYEPKTHSIGVGLELVLTTQEGKTITIELDPDNDLCRMDGEYIFYGAPDEPCYIEKLWYYLDLQSWPDAVYTDCENAFRLQGVG